MESPCLQETSPESDSPTISPRSKIIVSKNIMASIKRNLMSKETSVYCLRLEDCA